MISNILLYTSTGLILVALIGYILMIIIGSKKIVSKSNGFNVTKDIISEYNSINVIESKNYFTLYNIKRKVIKLTSKCYYGNDLSSISIALIESGISIVDNYKNKYIDLFRKVFSNLKMLYIFPIISIFINYSSYNVNDAKVSMIFIILFSVITYMLVDIKSQAFNWVSENLGKVRYVSKENYVKIMNYINKILWLDKIIFFGELIMIVRFISILLGIN